MLYLCILVNTGIRIFIPFVIAMILKLAMGASTVAMITTAGMMAPLMASMGFTSPLAKVLVVRISCLTMKWRSSS